MGQDLFIKPGGASTCRLIPTKTGQTTSYVDYDDGFYEDGRLHDFLTLEENNVFGNTTRFVDEFGGTTFTNGIIIDTAQDDKENEKILGWAKGTFGTFTRDNAASDANGQTIGGFSVWKLPNANEMASILNWGSGTQLLQYSPFNLSSISTWTGTSVDASNGLIVASASASIWLRFAIANTRSVVLYSRYFTYAELGV